MEAFQSPVKFLNQASGQSWQPGLTWEHQGGNGLCKVFSEEKGPCLNLLCSVGEISSPLRTRMPPPNPRSPWKLRPLFRSRIPESMWGAHDQDGNPRSASTTVVLSQDWL